MNQNGLVSVEYMFKGESAHAAGAPWRGKSALDAVELMDVGWNFRREHLRLAQRSHYVITNGGDQPNVVPPNASVWYYFREADYDHIMDMWHIGDNMAKGATLMTDTTYTARLLGSAWPGHFSPVIAETMSANIQKVGMPQWTDADQELARGLQAELKVPVRGLSTRVPAGRGGRGGAPRRRGCARRGREWRRWIRRRPRRSHAHRRRLRRYRRRVVGRADRSPCAIRRTFPAAPDTIGRTASRWRRRSRTKA